MVVGELAEPVDVLVVGAGPGGYVAAIRAAELGRSVVVVDSGPPEGGPGGTCLRVGCIPSKALIELADSASNLEGLAATGLKVAGATVDLRAFQVWKDSIIQRLSGGIDLLFHKHRIVITEGTLRFNKPNRAVVVLSNGQNQFFEFKNAIVATGSRATRLSALPPDGQRVLTSTDALALDELPGSLAVVGAGYIGLEIGIAFAKLGTQVTIIESADRILPSIDETLTSPISRTLRRLGINLHLNSLVAGLDEDGLILTNSVGERRVAAEKVLVAIGRTPNTDDVGLAAAGIQVGVDGLIPVDPRRLATPHIAAIGDVTYGPPLAHKASAEAIVAAEAMSDIRSAFEPRAIPIAIFTDPEIATVGLSDEAARAAGFDVVTGLVPLSSSGRAATLGVQDGFTQVVIDPTLDRLLGVHIVGPHASELIAEAALAIEMVASPHDLMETIHPHPTLSEGLQAALTKAMGKAASAYRQSAPRPAI